MKRKDLIPALLLFIGFYLLGLTLQVIDAVMVANEPKDKPCVMDMYRRGCD